MAYPHENLEDILEGVREISFVLFLHLEAQ
jgi:hypothetical protein